MRKIDSIISKRAIALLAIFTLWHSVIAAESNPKGGDANLKAVLEQPVLANGQALAEVKRYCERRIAVLPHFASWSAWQHEADRIRQRVLDEIVFRGVPQTWRDSTRRVEWLDTIAGGPGYHIKKLRYEAIPGLWIPALLYEPEKLTGRVPVVLNVNGHDPNGKQAPYKQVRCINLAKRGMVALNLEWLGMGQLHGPGFSHGRMNQIDLCGTSGLALFYLAMERGLDILVDHPNTDIDRVGMAGLSGGGWQTIILSSLDRRVTLANPVAGYSAFTTRVQFFSDLGDSEQAPTDLAALADFTHLTALRAPRPTLLTYNSKDDCCFQSSHALQPLVDAVKPIYELAGAESRLRTHVNDDPGTHNFLKDNREAFYKLVGDYFYPGDSKFSAADIDSEREVKTAEELNIPLPAENLDFHKVAMATMVSLPKPSHNADQPGKQDSAPRRPTAADIAQVAKLKDYAPRGEMLKEISVGDTHIRNWQLKLGDDWTVPIMELWRGMPKSTVCITADDGKASQADQISKLLADGQRVLAIDPFYRGECKLDDRGYLFAMFVDCVGGRSLGVQADELQAVARWATTQFGEPLSQQIAVGPRSSLAALVATATAADDERPQQLIVQGSLGSLRDIISNDWNANKYPEMFCFGLLKACDIEDLNELAKPCVVVRK